MQKSFKTGRGGSARVRERLNFSPPSLFHPVLTLKEKYISEKMHACGGGI